MVISKKPYAIIVIGLEWSSLFAKLIFKVGFNSLNSFATQNGRSRDPLFADLCCSLQINLLNFFCKTAVMYYIIGSFHNLLGLRLHHIGRHLSFLIFSILTCLIQYVSNKMLFEPQVRQVFSQ